MPLQVAQVLLAVIQVEHLDHARLKCHRHELTRQGNGVVQRLVLPFRDLAVDVQPLQLLARESGSPVDVGFVVVPEDEQRAVGQVLLALYEFRRLQKRGRAEAQGQVANRLVFYHLPLVEHACAAGIEVVALHVD